MSPTCVNCGKEVKEVCGDGYCRACHVSVSFEDCVNGTWVAKNMMKVGFTREHMKELFPEAEI